MQKLGLEGSDMASTGVNSAQGFDPNVWQAMKARLVQIFKTRTRDESCILM